MLANIGLAVGLFLATNVDNLLAATALTAAGRVDGGTDVWKVWVGQWIGMALITVLALLVARGIAAVPAKALAVIGLIPIVLGIRGFIQAFRADAKLQPARSATGTLFGFIAVALGNSADNLAAYVPAFRVFSETQALVTLVVFAVGALTWCTVGIVCASQAVVLRILDHLGRWLLPTVFVIVGAASVVRAL